jgi:hypothetical protein
MLGSGGPAVGPRPSTIWCLELVTEPGPDRDAHPNLSPPHPGEHPEQSDEPARSAGGRGPPGDAPMDVLNACCAGLDVHKKTVVACALRTGPDGRERSQVRSFGATTAGLMELADWLAESGVTRAAMESTGVYLKPVWHLLEGRVELMLVNARHIEQVPGRKADC